MIWGFENMSGMGWGGFPPPLPEGQLEQILIECKYVANCHQNHDRIDDFTTGCQ